MGDERMGKVGGWGKEGDEMVNGKKDGWRGERWMDRWRGERARRQRNERVGRQKDGGKGTEVWVDE